MCACYTASGPVLDTPPIKSRVALGFCSGYALSTLRLCLSFAQAVSYGPVSHAQKTIDLLNQALKEAIQCGGGGADGSGCKGPRADAIQSIQSAIASMKKAL